MTTTRSRPSEGEVVNALTSAMHAAGFNPGSIEVDTVDFVRFDAPGDKPGRKNGFYKVKTGDYPTAWFGDWKTGEQHHWQFYEPGTLSDRERKHIQSEHRRLKAEAQLETENRHKERAEDARKKWDAASADAAGHAYLTRKMIDPPKGLRLHIGADGTQLVVVPMWAFDMNGNPRLWNLQYIGPDGQKRFMKGARIDGTFFSLRGAQDRQIILLCEGTATGFSLWRATGLSVVIAFNSGNLIKVARELQSWRPMADVLVCADDDVTPPDNWAEIGRGRPWQNAGVKAAERTARAIGCKWITPVFAKGPARHRTDFNDLEREESLDAVNRQVWGALSGPIVPEGADDGEAPAARPAAHPQDESWRQKLPRTTSGPYDGGNVEGVALFIQNHRLLAGRLAFNQFTREIEVDGAPMQKHHIAEFRKLMHTERYKARKDDVSDEMEAEARRNQYDPLQDYLGSVKWDGKPRIDRWLIDYIGTTDDEYYRGIGPRILIGAVARARRPGCKLDTMPVFEGPQGVGKSTAVRYLFGAQFFIDDLADFHSKDSFQLIQGAWVCEVAELAALGKAEINDVKKFLSKQQDKYRAPYERAPISVPRRTIFFGTVNPEYGGGYLRDTTGGRRFWPIACGKIDLRGLLRDRDQLWAEAVQRYEAGAKWHLDDPKLERLAEQMQTHRREVHPWEDAIRYYLAGGSNKSPIRRTTISELLAEAIKLPVDRRDARAARQVGGILRAMGWQAEEEWPRDGGPPIAVFVDPDGDLLD